MSVAREITASMTEKYKLLGGNAALQLARLAFLDYANPVRHADKRSCFWRIATSKIITGPNYAISFRFTLYVKQVSEHFHSTSFLNSNVSLRVELKPCVENCHYIYLKIQQSGDEDGGKFKR